MRSVAFVLTLILIFIIPWEGVLNFPLLGNQISSTISKFMGIGVAAFWVMTAIFTRRIRKLGAFHVVFLLFVIWNAVSIYWSKDPERTFAHALTWFQLFLFVLILWDLYTTKPALRAGLQAYVLGAYIAFASAIYNFLSGSAFYTYYDRFSSGDTNPDGFAFIMVLGIPAAWYLVSSESTSRWSRLLKFVNYCYIPIAFLGIALSGTRTSLVASIPGIAFGLLSMTRLRISTRLAIMVSLFVGIILLLPFVQPLRSFQRLGTLTAELTQGDLNNRTNNWKEGLEAFKEYPIMGVGSNMYRSVNTWGKVAHNSFLSVLVEVGLVGFVLFGFILTIAVSEAWGQPKWYALFWLTVLLVWAIGSFTLTWEYRKSTWVFLSLLISSAAIFKTQAETEQQAGRQKAGTRGISLPKLRELTPGEKERPSFV
ncbi:MAG TPA: O-antigen ligase family protein [Anaerolineales bacterium]|nr:O-antigen ligase family protein [Anaerolineales bacterium]